MIGTTDNPALSEDPKSFPRESQAPSRERLHLGFLDGVRALAALQVIIIHCWQVIYWEPGSPQPGRMMSMVERVFVAGFPVQLFIVLSGYCLMLPVIRGDGKLRGGVTTFFYRRARRIIPPYYAAVLLAIIVGWVLRYDSAYRLGWNSPITFRTFVLHLLLIRYTSEINPTFWSIALEWHLYFFFPLIVFAWYRLGVWRGAAVSLLTAVILCYLTRYTVIHGLTPIKGLPGVYGFCFVLGALGASIAHAPQLHGIRDRIAWLWAAVIAFVAFQALGSLDPYHLLYHGFVAGISGMCLLVACSTPPAAGLRRALECRPLTLIGSFSYSLYLTHTNVIEAVWQYVIGPMRLPAAYEFWGMLIISAPAALLAAFLFYWVFERPFLNTRPVPRSIFLPALLKRGRLIPKLGE